MKGTLQSASGVGGLLAMQDKETNQSYLYCYDGGGNVVSMISLLDGVLSAVYEYSPFGEVIRATGSMASTNPFGFATKYLDGEVGCVYYGFRLFRPNLGCWLSRDSLGENGGYNLYNACLNDPISYIDGDGLKPFKQDSYSSDDTVAELADLRQALLSAPANPTYGGAQTMLKHWLEGGGTPYGVQPSFLQGNGSIKDKVNLLKERMRNLADRGSLGGQSISSYALANATVCGQAISIPVVRWDTLVKFNQLIDPAYYMFGTATLSGWGKYKATLICDCWNNKIKIRVEGVVKLYFYDYYNWDTGKGTRLPDGGPYIHDSAFKKLKENGMGADFRVESYWEEADGWDIPIKK